MFSGLKEKLGATAIETAVNKFSPMLTEQMAKITSLKASDVNDDENFESVIVSPILMAINAASIGTTKLIPNFDDRFKSAMYHIRNELVETDGDSVRFIEGSKERLPQILLESMKSPA